MGFIKTRDYSSSSKTDHKTKSCVDQRIEELRRPSIKIVMASIKGPRRTVLAVLETLACREALALAEDLGLTRVHVVVDCNTTANVIATGFLGRYWCYNW
jgi:hypothetical protein